MSEERGGAPLPTSGGSPAPAEPPRHVMDDVERTVNRVLLVGVAVSVALMVAGLIFGVVDKVLLGVVNGEILPSGVVPLADLPSGLAARDPGAYLSLGLIALIATPFVRVAGSIVAFAREHDRRYVTITAIVLAVMCLSVALGKA